MSYKSHLSRFCLTFCAATALVLLGSAAVSTHASMIPVSHWKFDETDGTMAFDSVPLGTDGTVGSNVTRVTGVSGNAYEFNNANLDLANKTGIINFGNATSAINPIVASDQITISAWLNWTFDHTTRGTAISFARPVSPAATGNTNFIQIGVTGSVSGHNTKGGIFGGINVAATTWEVVNTTGSNPTPGGSLVTAIPVDGGTALDDGQWHHVALTVDAIGNKVELFVNGVSVGTNPTLPPPVDIPLFPTFTSFEVGRLGRFAPAAPFTGKVDDIQVYDRVLSAAEIRALHAHPGVAIPEPATLTLLGLGLGGIVLFVRRRRA